ncbi:sugar-binding transcriptional regulator [Hoyosella subflava]|uniref:Putative transcriptional regulator n=1 Tax=Hoyosella subflava (strain DSM 45089 / JCM 17490 / NBRC 109087 / DQS3-9A1) TaxID=443218 RepID=F6EMT9_HOYSD|nr:sugar-binding domain-containing protein [Hoyosella subflava]AEF42831.1 putative transcriptional regulator [Hoyosella subflava DQS3-9A1]
MVTSHAPGSPDQASSSEDLRVCLRAATLYYLDGLTQADVAARLGVSRPTAGRLVARARSEGLVSIEVHVPKHLREDLHSEEERALEEKFGLIEAVVVTDNVDSFEGSFTSVGRAAAALVARRIKPKDTLGFTWGPETVAVAQALPPNTATAKEIVQLDGSMSAINYQTGVEYILGRCGTQLKAATVRLPAPLYADAPTVTAMKADSVISAALKKGSEANMMIFGVGAASTATTLFEGSYIDSDTIGILTGLGAAGEIGGQFYDQDGVAVDGPLNDRTLSVGLDQVRACPNSILITGGTTKHEAALGALRGGLAKMLVSDIECAQWLLNQR